MRVLVLGGCGFVGSHVVDGLLARRHAVRVVARRPEVHRRPLVGVDYRMIDFRDLAALAGALSGCDAVIHLISATTPGSADLDPAFDVTANLVPTLGLLDLMVRFGPRRLIHMSSGGTVYGVADQVPTSEDHPLRPISSYGIVKVAMESYITTYGQPRGLSPVILRPSNSYGERQGPDGASGLVSRLLVNARTGGQVDIWGDGGIQRDYLHVRDLARLCVLAVESDAVGTFNAGSGIATSVRSLIDMVMQVTGRHLKVSYGPGRLLDVPVNVLDSAAARSTFGWTAGISLQDGLRDCWGWHLQSNAGAKESPPGG